MPKEKAEQNNTEERAEQEHPPRFGDIQLNLLAGRLRIGEEELLLSRRELALLSLLIDHGGEATSQRELYERVWGRPFSENGVTLKNAISQLRHKLSGHGYRITAIWGVGYQLERAEE